MPIQLHNDFGEITLSELLEKQGAGFSVMKTPHIGNQHPSNLACSALGFHLHMVSFTKGERDVNFHPHLRIEGGVSFNLSCPTCWTPFAKTPCGTSLEEYHQESVKQCFVGLKVTTDIGTLRTNRQLAKDVLVTATKSMSSLWYRRVTTAGEVYHLREHNLPHYEKILRDIFGFNNDSSGWIVPNRAYVLHDCIMQSLESGRDIIYHLAGPQMIGYVGKQLKSVSKAYDVFRLQYPLYGLPEVLHLHVVPVSSSRFITHGSRKSDLDEVVKVIQWYEALENQEKRFASERFAEVAFAFPEFFTPIETASCMSQYDVTSGEELYLSPWMLNTPLNRVQKMHEKFIRHIALVT